jgi:hypothetical protein
MLNVSTVARGITAADVADLAAQAGADFTWPAKGGDRFPAKYVGVTGFRQIVRNYLFDVQEGICAVCGNGMVRGDVASGEINHVVSRGPVVKGFVERNLFLGHPACNRQCAVEAGEVAFGMLLRPDVIAREIPSKAVLARSGL